MTTLGEAKIEIRLDTTEADRDLGKTDIRAKKVKREEDRQKRTEHEKKRQDEKQQAVQEAGLLRRGHGAVVHRVRQVVGLATAGSALIGMAAGAVAAVPLPGTDLLAAGIRGADIAEKYGPQAVGLTRAALGALSEAATGTNLLDNPVAKKLFDELQEQINSVAGTMTLLKAKLDAVVGAGDDTIQLAKGAALLGKGLAGGDIKDAYLELHKVHTALNAAAAHEKIIRRAFFVKELGDAMARGVRQ